MPHQSHPQNRPVEVLELAVPTRLDNSQHLATHPKNRNRRRMMKPHTKSDYALAAFRLRLIKLELDAFLYKARGLVYKNMRQVSPGIWIHNDFKDLAEALAWLNSMLPPA